MASTNSASESPAVTRLIFYGAVALIAYLAYQIVEPFLAEIAWAVVLAICLSPLQARLRPRFGPTKTAIFLTLMVVLLLIAPLLFVVQALVREGAQAVDTIQGHIADRGGPLSVLHHAWQWLHQRLPFLPAEEKIVARLQAALGGVAGVVASRAGSIVKGTVSLLFSTGIMLCVLFFILKDAPQMARSARRLMPFGSERNAQMLGLIRDIVSTSVTSTLIIAIIQGIVGAIAFLLLGVDGAMLWGALMAVLSVLPAVGSALVWAPAAIVLALSGHIVKGVILALVGVLIMGNVDNVVRPLMLSGRARMSTLVLIISLLGGVSAFGFIGIVLGPVVAAVLTGLVETYALGPEEPVPPPAAEPAAAPDTTVAQAPATEGDILSESTRSGSSHQPR
jgi:predicted PurR-regulated permease PerM